MESTEKKKEVDMPSSNMKKKIGFFAINISVMAVLVVALVLYFFNIYLPNTTRHGESITVPSIVGMNMAELDDFLGAKELRYHVNDSTYSVDVKPFTVLSQHPVPGSKVKQSRKIYITVSSKIPPLVKMPNLKDFSLRNAEMTLKSYGLLMDVEYAPSPYSNLVLEQHFKNKPIEEGRTIPKGSKIKLLVGNGTGNDDREVPNLLGMPFDEAEVSLTAKELQINKVKEEIIPGKTPGSIIRQRPEAGPGKKVKVGEVIDVWVAQ